MRKHGLWTLAAVLAATMAASAPTTVAGSEDNDDEEQVMPMGRGMMGQGGGMMGQGRGYGMAPGYGMRQGMPAPRQPGRAGAGQRPYGPMMGYGGGPMMGPGMMGPGMMGPGMMGSGCGMGPGMMGPGMMGPGMMGRGMMGPGYGGGPMMGPGMMGPGMMGPGYGMGPQYGTEAPYGGEVSTDDVKMVLEHHLAMWNNPNLKLGSVADDEDAIVAEIVTKDGSLVKRYRVDKQTGQWRPAN